MWCRIMKGMRQRAGRGCREGVRRGKKNKTEFVMTEEIASQLHYSARMSLSDLVGQMNDLRDESTMKRLTIKAVEQMLLDEGLFE